MSQTWRNLPKEFLKRLESIIPSDKLHTILEAYTLSRPTTLRVNTLKTTVDQLTQLFDEQHILYEPSNISPIAFITRSDKRMLLDLDAYTDGLFYIQSLSSMLPVLALDPKLNEKILDIALKNLYVIN